MCVLIFLKVLGLGCSLSPDSILFNYESRDYEGFDLTLKMNDNLTFEASEIEIEDLNPYLIIFLNYAIKKKEFTFTMSDITSTLNLNILPSTFGKILNDNLDILKKEGLHIEYKKTAIQRLYTAKYEEAIDENM